MTPASKSDSADEQGLAVYALTKQGAEIALKLYDGLSHFGGNGRVFLPRRFASIHGDRACYFDSFKETLSHEFKKFTGHLIVGAAGMVVRLIAPLLVSKKEDPAVVVMPQDGRYAISILSGHLGGGNKLAWEAARICGGQAVVSTATDVEGLPALEVVARDNDLAVENFHILPAISRMLVEGEKVKIFDPHEFLKPHLLPWIDNFDFISSPSQSSVPHVRVDSRQRKGDENALIMRPKIIAIGLGCHRGVSREEVEDLIESSLKEAGVSPLSIAVLATVETRRREPALVEISRTLSRPLNIFTKEELGRIQTPNPSSKVMERIGVASVCEAAAMLAAKTEYLLISKKKNARTTLAAALCGWK